MFNKFWNHPYITSAKGLGRWVQIMSIFADVRYFIYANIEGWLVGVWVRGSEKAQKYSDVIKEWSLRKKGVEWTFTLLRHCTLHIP